MRLEFLKAGFQSFLEELSQISNKEYALTDSDVSIFMYANEFKNYISDEIDVDPKVLSMSINDILNMEIVNGKLVDPNEEEDTKAEDIEEKTETETEAETTTETEEIAPEDSALAMQEDTQGATEEGTATTETTTSAKGDNVQQYGENPTINMGEIPVSDMLNELFELDTIKETIDTDVDGELNEEEIQTFLNAIKGYDGNDQDISLEDIFNSLQAIADGKFSLDPEAEAKIEEEEKPEEIKEEAVESANESTGTTPSRNVGGTSGTGSVGGSSGAVQSSTPQEKTLDNMTKEELKSELSSAQSDLSEKQNKLSSILDGSDEKLQSLNENKEKLYDTYQEELEKVDKDMAEQVDTLKQDIDSKQDEIDSKDQEIADQEGVVSESENAYNNAVSTRENLEASLSALQGVDTADMDSDKKSELSSKIAELQSKISDAKEAENNAKEAWDNAEEKLDTLNEERETLQGELDELEKQMTDLEAEIVEKYPQMKEYMDAYNEADEEYKEYKESATASAKAEIQEAQDYVNEVNTAINNYDNRETAKEYCFGDFGEEVLEYAKQFIGANEADGSADKFVAAWGTTSSATPWCAAFVDYVLSNCESADDVPDWYKNIGNKWYCPNVDAAAKSADAIISADEVQQGDIVLFDWDGDGTKDHIGIVDSTENGQVITIEGNTSDQVAQRTYNLNDSRLTFCKMTA